MSAHTPHSSNDYYWKGGDVSGITSDWYYTVGATFGLTAGYTAGIYHNAATGGMTLPSNAFDAHVFVMHAVRGDGVVEVGTIVGSGQTSPNVYVTPLTNYTLDDDVFPIITTGATGQLGTGSLPYLGGTAGSWDYKEHWLVAVSGTTGDDGGGWTGHGYYFDKAVRPPHGGDNVWFAKEYTDSSIGLYVGLPAHDLIYGGWNGATWNGITAGGATSDVAVVGPCIIRDTWNYDYPVGMTSGAGVRVHASEMRFLSNSNYSYKFGAGCSLGYVLSEGTHSLSIWNSTIQDLELRKSSGLNDTGQYGGFLGHGNTYNSSVSIMGYASGRFCIVGGYGGSGGFVPAINIAPLYRDPITIDVDVTNLVVAPAAKTSGATGAYSTIEPVNIISSVDGHRRYIKELIQTPENTTEFGQIVGTQTNNPVTFSCGATVDNHTFGAGSVGVGSDARESDDITIIDGYIGSGCLVDTIHPNNPRWVGFIIGQVHGNTQEGYLVTDETGSATFKFSRGHFVKADFGDVRGAADSSIVSQSGGKG